MWWGVQLPHEDKVDYLWIVWMQNLSVGTTFAVYGSLYIVQTSLLVSTSLYVSAFEGGYSLGLNLIAFRAHVNSTFCTTQVLLQSIVRMPVKCPYVKSCIPDVLPVDLVDFWTATYGIGLPCLLQCELVLYYCILLASQDVLILRLLVHFPCCSYETFFGS